MILLELSQPRSHRSLERLGPWSAALIIATATGIAWCLFISLLIVTYQEWFNPKPWLGSKHESIAIAADGTPLIQTLTLLEHGKTHTTFHALGDPTLIDSSNLRVRPRMSFNSLSIRNDSVRYFPGRFRARSVPTNVRGHWYQVVPTSAGDRCYFAGFDTDDRRSIGYIGKNGFSTSVPESADQFHVSPARAVELETLFPIADTTDDKESRELKWDQVLVARDGVWLIDFHERIVRQLVGLEEDFGARTSADTIDAQYRSESPQYVVVRTKDRIAILNARGQELATWSIPKELREQQFEFYGRPGGPGIAVATEYGFEQYDQRLVTFSSDGAITRDEIVLSDQVRTLMQQTVRRIGSLIGCAVPMPATAVWLEWLYFEVSRDLASPNPNDRLTHGQFLLAIWPAYLGLFFVGLASAYAVNRHRRKCGLARSWTWMAFAFVFGLPGYGGYLLHRRWQLLEPCSACNQTVPLDRASCSNCDRAFPRPVLTGAEVFA